jgi:hypothetical protein
MIHTFALKENVNKKKNWLFSIENGPNESDIGFFSTSSHYPVTGR